MDRREGPWRRKCCATRTRECILHSINARYKIGPLFYTIHKYRHSIPCHWVRDRMDQGNSWFLWQYKVAFKTGCTQFGRTHCWHSLGRRCSSRFSFVLREHALLKETIGVLKFNAIPLLYSVHTRIVLLNHFLELFCSRCDFEMLMFWGHVLENVFAKQTYMCLDMSIPLTRGQLWQVVVAYAS